MSNSNVSTLAAPSGIALLRAALGLAVVALFICGFSYSVVATGLGQLLFPNQANGSLIMHQDQVVGSSLVAQPFVSDQYFYARPSASKYDVMTMSGSNLAQSNPELQQQVQQRAQAIALREQVGLEKIPSDLVTMSGSGIDPEISVQAALIQIPRIAKQRGITVEQLHTFVMQQVKQPTLGLLGQERINVLELNWAMDKNLKTAT